MDVHVDIYRSNICCLTLLALTLEVLWFRLIW
jgi:hypothetical protein